MPTFLRCKSKKKKLTTDANVMDENSTGVFNAKTHSGHLPSVLGSKNESENLMTKLIGPPLVSSSGTHQRALSGSTQHFGNLDNEPDWTTNLERLIALYREKCAQRILVHREAATYYNRRLKLFSVPGAILGAIGTSTVFVTWKSESCREQWHEITLLASGVCMLLSTALNALVAQSQYQALFAAHLKSYRNFDKMLKKLTVELCFERRYRQNVRDFIETMLREYDHLVDEAELVPTSVEKKIKNLLAQEKPAFFKNDPYEDDSDDTETDSALLESGGIVSVSENSADDYFDENEHARRASAVNFENETANATELQQFFPRESGSSEKELLPQTTVSSLMQNKFSKRRPSAKTRPSNAKNTTQRRGTLLDTSCAISSRMPMTSMANLDRFTFQTPGRSVGSAKRAMENERKLFERSASPQNQFDNSKRESDAKQSLTTSTTFSLISTASPNKDENSQQNRSPTRLRARFAQTEQMANEESHQTLVNSVTAQGMDNLAKSHEQSHSSSSSPTKNNNANHSGDSTSSDSSISTEGSEEESGNSALQTCDSAVNAKSGFQQVDVGDTQTTPKQNEKKVRFRKSSVH